MLKKFVSSILAVTLLCGCGSAKEPTVETSSEDVHEISKDLVEDLGMSDHMDEVKDRVVNGLFFFEEGDLDAGSVYLANNKTADVVGVFVANDMDNTKKCVETYLSTLKEQTLTYSPDELFKIDNAIIKDNGKMLILVVCDDIEKGNADVDKALGK